MEVALGGPSRGVKEDMEGWRGVCDDGSGRREGVLLR